MASCYNALNYIGSLARSSSRYGWGSGIIHMDYVNCAGTEISIVNCTYSTNFGSNCNHNTLAGVICQGAISYIIGMKLCNYRWW